MSRKSAPPAYKRWLFRSLALGFSLMVGLAFTEIVLRAWQRHVAGSDRLDAGLIRHDPTLGWTLNPSWRGKHRHLDFDVSYQVAPSGFRADPALPWNRQGQKIALIGDSFTFGLGVNDNETFASLLNRDTTNVWLNCGVPGFSTDQELLLLERDVLPLRPDVVVLVVYLANDILDNLRSVPLQVGLPKPFFRLEGDGLTLQNSPVPPLASAPAPGDLAGALIGPESRYAWRRKLESRFATLRLASEIFPAPDLSTEFARRFAPALEVFFRLVSRMRKDCVAQGSGFKVVLLGGGSLVEAPMSVSGQFQEYLRQAITTEFQRRGVPVVDIGKAMRERSSGGHTGWFHSHEGHLTPAGHVFTADYLRPRLGEELAAGTR